jgi:hypothetical protein
MNMHRSAPLVCACLLALAPSAFAAQLVVPRDFPTIQAAVDAATPGSTILLQPGTYTEELLIEKSLSFKPLQPVGHGVTIRSPAKLTPFAIDHEHAEREVVAVVRVGNAAHVSFSDLTVSGFTPCGPDVAGIIAVDDAALRLRNVRVTNIRPTSDCPVRQAHGNGVWVGLPPFIEMNREFGTGGSLDARNILVDRFAADGVLGVSFGEQRAEIRLADSIVNGGPANPGLIQSGVIVDGNIRAVVRDNAIGPIHCTREDRCGPDLAEQFQGVAIGTGPLSGDDQVIANNFLFGTDIGIWPFGGLSGISGNFIATRLFGLLLQDGDYATDHNVIVSGAAGIVALATEADTTVRSRRDFVTRNVDEPTLELEPAKFNATIVRIP